MHVHNVYVCMCITMCVCVHVCVHVCMHVCMCMCVYVHAPTLTWLHYLLGSFPIYLDVAAYLTVTATDVFGTIATVTLVSQAARE